MTQSLDSHIEKQYQVSTLPSTEVMRRIQELDLDCIKFKLMDSNEGQGWSRDKAEQVETQYKRFLFMSVTEGSSIVPTKEIDSFWHNHILDTHKYAADCDSTFGFFLHHFPYLGMRGEEDAARLHSSFEKTKEVHQRVFGDSYGADANDCENCGSCASTCGVGDSYTEESLESIRPTLPALSE